MWVWVSTNALSAFCSLAATGFLFGYSAPCQTAIFRCSASMPPRACHAGFTGSRDHGITVSRARDRSAREKPLLKPVFASTTAPVQRSHRADRWAEDTSPRTHPRGNADDEARAWIRSSKTERRKHPQYRPQRAETEVPLESSGCTNAEIAAQAVQRGQFGSQADAITKVQLKIGPD